MVSLRSHLAGEQVAATRPLAAIKSFSSSFSQSKAGKSRTRTRTIRKIFAQLARNFDCCSTVVRRGGTLSALLLLVAVLTAHAAEQSLVLDTWFSAQTNLHSFTADVIQTRTLKVLSQPLVSTGKVWVVIPNRFRWEIGQPAQTIALRQPDTLFLIYPRLKRAEKYPLNDNQPGPWRDALALLEASFPRSRADLESHFRVLSVTETNANWELILQPKNALARQMMAEIGITVRTNDFSLAATEMKFADGSRMRNDFTNVVLNPVLGEEIFDAKLDPGITVVEPLRQ